ncbi:hypothetical protein VB773_21200 [Haloarculaceae archaeon H-GB2-1]|nr:hypothetical protein [Haloarculaceae archaeon H-GB2-1]
MAHSWVQSFPTERAAFETFVAEYGDESILLIDTYDTVAGAELARDVAAAAGVDLAGVRLDSGDLVDLSKSVDEILPDTDLFISSGVDEYFVRSFLSEGGVGAGFGPGTALVTSADAPTVEGVYKLVAVEREGEMRPSMKLSTGKVTYPGAKSVRRVEDDGEYANDTLGLVGEDGPGTELLEPVIDAGDLVYDVPDLSEIRERARRERRKLPPEVRDLDAPASYDVHVSDRLNEQTTAFQRDLEDRVT